MEIIDNLEIIDNTSEGVGVAKLNSITIFVQNSLVGDVVNAEILEKKKKFWIAKTTEIVKKSKFREENFSNEFSHIFPYINLEYKKEIELKNKSVLNNFKKNCNIEIENIEIVENEKNFNYRNKIELKINEKMDLCYYSDNGNNKIKVENCPLTDFTINSILKDIENLIKKYKIKPYNYNENTGILKNISIRSNYKKEIIITFISTKKDKNIFKVFDELKNNEKIISIFLNINENKNSTIMGKETIEIFKRKDFFDKIGKYEFKISPKSFFQVNKYQTVKLYEEAKKLLGTNKEQALLDLYCGIGTTSIYFSENFKKVIGVEVVKDSIEDAKENSKLNKVTNTKFIYGKSEDVVEKILKENKIEIVSVDPPRKGLDKKVVDTLIKTKIKKIVYISCNSATLTRDLKYFLEKEYKLEKIKNVDMFSKTSHVETVALLVRK